MRDSSISLHPWPCEHLFWVKREKADEVNKEEAVITNEILLPCSEVHGMSEVAAHLNPRQEVHSHLLYALSLYVKVLLREDCLVHAQVTNIDMSQHKKHLPQV